MPATEGSGGWLLSGITWTQWTVYCLIIILLVFIPVPASEHTQWFKDNACILSRHTSCGREGSWVFGLKRISLWGTAGFFNCEVWCCWCDFCGDVHLCVFLSSPLSLCECKSKCLLVTAGLHMHYSIPRGCKVTSVKEPHECVHIRVWVSAWASTLLPPLGFLSLQ